MVSGQCLCGAHRFELEGPFQLNHHCHCGFCRKHHGSAFLSLVGVAEDRMRWERGDVIAYSSSPGMIRESCATCGAGLAQRIEGLPTFVPAGFFDDLDTSFDFHIFTASKAPWHEIRDGVPTFDAYPPGVESTPAETRAPQGPAEGVRGSCLCGEVHYVIEGEPITARHCHCDRCRRGRAAAHASNLVTSTANLRFLGGEEHVRRYKVPEARFFTQCFCGNCGGKAPMVDPEREIVVTPMGSLDDPTPILPVEHIFTSEIPPWSGIHDDLPQYLQRPAPTS